MIVAGAFVSVAVHANTLDLSGEWSVRLDPRDVGEKQQWFKAVEGRPIHLPGIVSEAGLGDPLALEPALTKEVFSHLHQNFRYVGAAWYVREIDLPDGWSDATLLLERTIWQTSVWVNGRMAGSLNSLSTPHRHAVGAFLKPGKNIIAVRVDNRMQVDLGELGHAYTDQTQTIWNGLVGKIELRRENPIQIKTSPLRVVLPEGGKLAVKVEAINHDGPDLPAWSKIVKAGEVTIDLPAKKMVKWSEFNPALYRVTVEFNGQEKSVVTGFRDVEANGRDLLINGRKSFMRGTLECCIFPKTGYP
ncbi:sugar-binding domain-containing protein, partial [Pontiella sp.]|uniref:sugar-binding domain-containing protein n=1 Tax=Pontiella sp. TaxID=2837462 RepID=UPI0035683018